MGWSTGKDKHAPGKFAYELWLCDYNIHRVGGFSTMREADKAGARANTNLILYGEFAPPPQSLDEMLSDDELLAELLGD